MTTKQERMHRLISSLENLGFTFAEIQGLRRIEMTLSRWSEHECNGNIQRDGEDGDGAPRWYYETATGEHKRGAIIPDRERGALKRLAAIVAERNRRHSSDDVLAYHQTDPRGCSLYLVKRSQLLPNATTAREAAQLLPQLYARGIAVAA